MLPGAAFFCGLALSSREGKPSMCLRWLPAAGLFLAVCVTAFGQLVEAPKTEAPKVDAAKAEPPAAQPPAPPEKPAEKSAEAQTHKWEFGIAIRAVGGPCAGLLGTFPVPTDWPEQQVKVVAEQISPGAQHRYRNTDGLKQI